MYYVYFLHSKKFDRFYTGVTKDLQKRLRKHNSGSTKSTKPYRPWNLVYHEIYDQKNLAYKREYYLKSPLGYIEKRKIIVKIRGRIA